MIVPWSQYDRKEESVQANTQETVHAARLRSLASIKVFTNLNAVEKLAFILRTSLVYFLSFRLLSDARLRNERKSMGVNDDARGI